MGSPDLCHTCRWALTLCPGSVSPPAREQLRVHLRRHKGVRKFQCSDCGYKFTRQVRTHLYQEEPPPPTFESSPSPPGRQAHLRRHVQVHKRTENYNPQQRKLRNIIVQEVDVGPSEHKPGEGVEASMVSEQGGYIAKETANLEPDAAGGLHPGCVIEGMDAGHMVMEEVVAHQNLGEDVAAESFSVSEVLRSYGSSVQEMVQSITESKT